MKGPYHRLKFDLRRHWECPVCQHRSHTLGNVTSCLCRCQQSIEPAARRFMRLVEVAEQRTGEQQVVVQSVQVHATAATTATASHEESQKSAAGPVPEPGSEPGVDSQ